MLLKGEVIRKILGTKLNSNEPRGKQRGPSIKMKGKPMSYAEEIRYLGFIFDEKMSFKRHIQNAPGKAKQHFYVIRRAAKANWSFGLEYLRTLYKRIGECIMLYGAV